MKTEATIHLDFETEKQLSVIYDALKPEVLKPSSSRSTVSIEKKGTVLTLKVEAFDTVALRTALNTYLHWINSLRNVVKAVEGSS